MREHSEPSVHFDKYFSEQYPRLTSDRPQLLEVARRLESFIMREREGDTFDVFNVSMPTRFGKSLLSTALSTWILTRVSPRYRILRASYAAELAESFSKQVRSNIEEFYYPRFRGRATEGTQARWRIIGNAEDNHAGCGIEGGITGFGFDLAIIDDTAKNMIDATSAAYSKHLKTFKESVLMGRMEGKRKILNVGTRWTINDWFSMWPDAESYVLPAMIDGGSCCEAWKTTAALEMERENVSGDVWDAQYMQAPTATGRIRLFEGWRPEAVATIPEGKPIAVIDPTTDYGQDWFVIGIYVRVAGFVYLIDMFAKQRATPEEAAAWLNERNYTVAWIETNGVGADVLNKMRKAGSKNLVGFATTSDKYSRAWLQMDNIKNYFRIFAAVDMEVVRELLVQADQFPAGEHDDLIDNVVMAFERLKI